VLGGLLVAVAMVVSFSLATRGRQGATEGVVVARRPVQVGRRLTAEDLAVEQVALPEDVAATTFRRPDDVVGAVALVPYERGAIVERAGLAPAGRDALGAQLSFAVDRAHALDGDLQVGDRVDLVATYGTGDTARTERVARSVRLVAVDGDAHGSLDAPGKLVVTVELSGDDDLVQVAHATDVAAVSLVRPGSSDRPSS
jgi:Flp pilus assembly protein CpaB